MKFTLVRNEEGDSSLTVFVTGRKPLTIGSTHPKFEEVVTKVMAEDESALDLIDLATAAALKFEPLTERVSIRNGEMYLDGDVVHNALAGQVVRFIEEGVEDWKPLVAFYENLMANPNEHSRNQLFPWIERQNLSITPDGLMVGYKGVNRSETDENVLVSGYAGSAIVDGQPVEGYIPNAVGSTIEMPRTEVMHAPNRDCDAGLHVGSFEYASGYGQVVLEVHVNPRDVVSVPDAGWKLRTCRYKIVAVSEREHTTAVVEAQPERKPRKSVGRKVADAVKKAARKPVTVAKGNVFADADKRRYGNYFLVKSVEGDTAKGIRLPSGKSAEIKTERLASRAFNKLSRDEGRKVAKAAKVTA